MGTRGNPGPNGQPGKRGEPGTPGANGATGLPGNKGEPVKCTIVVMLVKLKGHWCEHLVSHTLISIFQPFFSGGCCYMTYLLCPITPATLFSCLWWTSWVLPIYANHPYGNFWHKYEMI